MGDYMAESYGLSAEEVASVVVNPDAPIPFLGSNVFRVDKIVEEYAGVAEPSFLVKWEGFTEEGNTIEQESDLHPDVVAEWRKLAPEDRHLYPSAHARDVRKGRVKPVAEAALGAETALTMTKIELQRIKAATSCGTFKAVQEKKRSDSKLRRMLMKRRRKIEEEREDRERRKTEKEARAKRAASARPPDRPGSLL
jgi:hypothetical protein